MQLGKARVLVISDLHLGGAPASGDKPGFQMCTEKGRAALEAFMNEVMAELWIAHDISRYSKERKSPEYYD